MLPLLDHVAIRVADRTATAHELVELLDVEVIEQTERFTLLGAHPDHGKLTLLDAAPGEPPTAQRLVTLVLADTLGANAPPIILGNGLALTFAAPDEADTEVPRHALIGLSLRASDPPIAAAELAQQHGMQVETISTDVAVLTINGPGSGRITLLRERWSADEPSLLDHLGVRVEDVARWEHGAHERGIEVVRRVDAPHSSAVFVRGPEQLLVEYVQLTAAFQQA